MPLLLLALLAQAPVSVTGYLDSRATGAATQLDGAAAVTELVEGNVQLKVDAHEKLKVVTDASLFWQAAGWIHGGDRDLPQLRPALVLSEAYLDAPLQESFRVVVGKKRLVWGAGLAFNPTDVLNPAKDPTDPTFQRAGAWLGQLEWGFERVALSLVLAGKATRQYAGLPTALVTYPEVPSAEAARGWVPDDRDDEAHYAAVARLYLLLADTDVNLLVAHTHLYNDAFRNKTRAGLSLSRVFGSLELHGEALLQTGSARVEANADCVDAPVRCVMRGVALAERPHLEADWLNARAVVGGRYQFDDGGFLSVEYSFNGEGHDAEGFRKLGILARTAPALMQQAVAGATDPGTPQKFSFEPLRRHYLVLQYSRPQLWDDWTLGASALVGLEDLSAQVVPQVQWMAREWLQLSLMAYLPVGGVPDWGVEVDGTRYGEFTLSPLGPRAMLQVRAFY